MGNLTIATTFIVLINVLMFLATLGMASINPEGTVCYNVQGSLISRVTSDASNMSVIDNYNFTGDLPKSEETTVTAGTTNIFTDIFNNIISFMKSAPGIKYVYGVVAAPYNILKCISLATTIPGAFIAAIGVMWYLITFLVLISFMWGRD